MGTFHCFAVSGIGLLTLIEFSASTTSTPRGKRKRLRSLTPSEAGLNRSDNGKDDSILRSPLAKRKKVVAERSSSPLKTSVPAAKTLTKSMMPSFIEEPDIGTPPQGWEEDSQMEGGGDFDDDAEGTEGGDFDFLADELDEEDEG